MQEQKHIIASFDGLGIHGTYTPSKGNSFAQVLLVHGITSERDESGFYSRMAKAFSDSGIESFRFEYRSHGESTLLSEEMTLCGIVSDIKASFEFMKSKSQQEKLARFAVGTSFGGGLTAFWADNNKDAINGLFLCAPVIDYEDDIRRNTDNWRNQLLKGEQVLYAGAMTFGRGLMNEMPYINGKRALMHPVVPVHIFHGDKDNDVPLESSLAVEGNAGKVYVHKIAGVGHGFGAPGDDDFETEQTAANHDAIYASMIKIMKDIAA